MKKKSHIFIHRLGQTGQPRAGTLPSPPPKFGTKISCQYSLPLPVILSIKSPRSFHPASNLYAHSHTVMWLVGTDQRPDRWASRSSSSERWRVQREILQATNNKFRQFPDPCRFFWPSTTKQKTLAEEKQKANKDEKSDEQNHFALV